MNTLKARGKFNNFQIILDSGRSFTVVMGSKIEKLTLKENAVMQWHKKGGSITINIKVKIDFTILELSAENILTRDCHVDESSKGRYDIILVRYILTA